MSVLLIWLCATASMDNCTVYTLSKPVPAAQCEDMKTVRAEVLGYGDAQNYRLECQEVTD